MLMSDKKDLVTIFKIKNQRGITECREECGLWNWSHLGLNLGFVLFFIGELG